MKKVNNKKKYFIFQEGGMPLPIRLAAEFPDELVATPIEDIDPYYQNKKVRNFKQTIQPKHLKQDNSINTIQSRHLKNII